MQTGTNSFALNIQMGSRNPLQRYVYAEYGASEHGGPLLLSIPSEPVGVRLGALSDLRATPSDCFRTVLIRGLDE